MGSNPRSGMAPSRNPRPPPIRPQSRGPSPRERDIAMSYLSKWFNKNKTPQSAPIPGTSQVANSDGRVRVRRRRLDAARSLPDPRVGRRQLLRDRAEADARERARASFVASRSTAGASSSASSPSRRPGRAPKNDPALFALALAAKLGDVDTRRAAFAALPRVARIGTHLFHFAEHVKALGGWGRGTMRAFARWYTEMEASRLALQAVKYQSRDGWSHRDLLRKAHPVAKDDRQQAIFHWMTKGWEGGRRRAAPGPGAGDDLGVRAGEEPARRRRMSALLCGAHPRSPPAARVRADGDEAASRRSGRRCSRRWASPRCCATSAR